MGTNYYHYDKDPCECCGRDYDCEHIGKSSGGWSFSFHGTDEIRSWAQWKKRLESGGRIEDEYGRLIPLEDFERLVESKRGGLNHTEECLNDPSDRHYALTKCWVDDEGNSFSSGEFS